MMMMRHPWLRRASRFLPTVPLYLTEPDDVWVENALASRGWFRTRLALWRATRVRGDDQTAFERRNTAAMLRRTLPPLVDHLTRHNYAVQIGGCRHGPRDERLATEWHTLSTHVFLWTARRRFAWITARADRWYDDETDYRIVSTRSRYWDHWVETRPTPFWTRVAKAVERLRWRVEGWVNPADEVPF